MIMKDYSFDFINYEKLQVQNAFAIIILCISSPKVDI